jgi:hypothetical protein
MLIIMIIPVGSWFRRNFTIWSVKKSYTNGFICHLADPWLSFCHRTMGNFFDIFPWVLRRLERMKDCATNINVELLVHQERRSEPGPFIGDPFWEAIESVNRISFRILGNRIVTWKSLLTA